MPRLSRRAVARRIVGLALAGALIGPVAIVTPAGSVTSFLGDDYHVANFGDPLDFSNPEDHVIADDSMLYRMSRASISDGMLRLDATGPSFFSALWGGFPTGIPHGREGGLHPIEADHYRRIVFRMNAPGGIPAMVRWFDCVEANDGCSGGFGFTTVGGWHTYDIVLAPNTADRSIDKPWRGDIVGVRVVFNPPGPIHLDVDWVRFVPLDLQPVDEIVGGAAPPVLPTDRLDYASAAGDPWDWDSIRDAASLVHLRDVRVENGWLHACNTNVDPGIVLRLPGGVPIDANRFKTLTVEYRYEGEFSSRNHSGGGTVARVFWFDNRGRHPTKGVHLYPNEQVFTVRLDDPRSVFTGPEPGKGVETGAPWEGQVTGFRLDPNQDPGGRCWSIGRIWLTADEPAVARVRPVGPATAAPSRVVPAVKGGHRRVRAAVPKRRGALPRRGIVKTRR